MSQARIDTRLRDELVAVARRAGCELLEARLAGGTLRLVLDRPSGVTLEDCETVSRQVSALLDVEDFGPGRYVLEVSSPGLDRKLYGPEDYRRFAGERVKVSWRDPASGAKRTATGRLDGYEEDPGQLVLAEEDNEQRHTIALERLLTVRLDPVI